MQRRSVSFRDIQTLVSGFNTRVRIYFVAERVPKLLAASLNIGEFEFSKFDLPYHQSNTDYMTDSSFKVTYAISVNSRRFYFP